MGDSVKGVIEEAIRTARVHIVIFSERFAESPWCLAELSYMLQTGTPIIPVFYYVDPSDLRWLDHGKGCYAPTFCRHERNGTYPSNKLQEWKMALQRVSNLPGYVLSRNIGDEGMVLKRIVNSVQEHGNFEQPVADAFAKMGLRHRKGKPRQHPAEKRQCDVFISHRVSDTKHTLASTIFHALDVNSIHAFLDVEELELGDSLPDEVQEAIRTSRLHVAIFSTGFADSPWCLAELSCMLETGTRIIPVYYNVEPFDLREKGCYAPAFSRHEEKGKYPSDKLQEWKMALQRISYLNGHRLNTANGEGILLKTIIKAAKEYNSKENNSDEWVRLKSTVFRFADLASPFNWAALLLVLGSYGLALSNVLFWMCWTILVIKAVIYNSYESEDTTRPYYAVDNILKLVMSFAFVTLLLCTEDMRKRQNIMLLIIAASVILFEGVTPLLKGTKGSSLKKNRKLKVLIFFIPSALNAMMSMTGPIVIGGDLGRLMCKQAICGFTLIFLVDALTEVIPRVVNGRRFPLVMSEDLPVPITHHVVVVLRMIVEGGLCCWMGKTIYQFSYFPSNLGIADCNKLCQERSKHLLITMVVLGGLQAVGTLIAYSLCCRHDPSLPL